MLFLFNLVSCFREDLSVNNFISAILDWFAVLRAVDNSIGCICHIEEYGKNGVFETCGYFFGDLNVLHLKLLRRRVGSWFFGEGFIWSGDGD